MVALYDGGTPINLVAFKCTANQYQLSRLFDVIDKSLKVLNKSLNTSNILPRITSCFC